MFCYLVDYDSTLRNQSIFWTLLTYLTPLMQILLIFCCVKIVRNRHVYATPKSIDENKEQDAATIMVFTVIALYFSLSLPFHFLNMKRALFPEGNTEEFIKIYDFYNK